jgi:general secretion pathway protein F
MAAFEYTALDTGGRTQRGVLEGDTPRQVRPQLRDKGWSPLAVDEVVRGESRTNGTASRRRLGLADVTLFTRQLATLVRSGMPLDQALGDVARQSGKNRVQRVVLAVRARVREGHSLANGLALFPAVFSELYRKTVQAGEQSGRLDVVLDRLADYLETSHEIRQKTMLALFYPALLTIVALAVVIGLVTYVVPQVVQVFENMNQQLPWITRALIAFSGFLRAYGIWLIAALAALAVAGSLALRNPATRMRWHELLLRLPLVGKLLRGTNSARFARTLSILAASSVPILDALRIAGEVLPILPMRQAVEEAATRVREGASLRGALEKSGHFPPMTLSLIGSGESSGNLQAMLERAAEVQEREVSTLVSVLLGLFEPLLILVMGGIVLVIVLAILLPIFDLNQLVH